MDQIEFGKYLKSLRKQKGLTIIELSNQSGVSNPYISQLENGKFTPSPEVIKKLSSVLEESFSGLLHAAGYEDLYEAARVAEVIDDFSDDFEVNQRDLILRVNAFEKAMDLKNLLEQDDLSLKTEGIRPYYNGHLLTEEDCQRVLKMLIALFPEYQQNSKSSK